MIEQKYKLTNTRVRLAERVTLTLTLTVATG